MVFLRQNEKYMMRKEKCAIYFMPLGQAQPLKFITKKKDQVKDKYLLIFCLVFFLAKNFAMRQFLAK